MVWYNPKSWFRKKQNNNLELYCDNPQCNKIIKDDELCYDEKNKEIYHTMDCALESSAIRANKSNEIDASNSYYITREEAIKLYLDGNLKQSKLEKLVLK